MLGTLIVDGFVVRDSMCRGYHITHKVRELYSGYEGIAELIEVARPSAIDLTARIKWPVAIGTLDVDAFAIRFWTDPSIRLRKLAMILLGSRIPSPRAPSVYLRSYAAGTAWNLPERRHGHNELAILIGDRHFGPDDAEFRFRLMTLQLRNFAGDLQYIPGPHRPPPAQVFYSKPDHRGSPYPPASTKSCIERVAIYQPLAMTDPNRPVAACFGSVCIG